MLAGAAAAVLHERFDQFRLHEVRRDELLQDQAQVTEVFRNVRRRHPELRLFPHLGLEVVLDPAQDGEACDEDGVRVVSLGRGLAKFDQTIDSAESKQIPTNGWIVAKSEI